MQACNPPDIFWPIALALRALDRHQVRLRPSRPVPRALTSPGSPTAPEPALPGAAGAGAQDAPDRGPRDLHQRVLPGHRRDPERQAGRRRHGRPDRPGPGAPAARCRPDPSCAGAAGSWPPTSASWGRRTGSTSSSRAADIVVHQLGRDDIAFTLIGSGDCFDDLVALRDELGLAGHVEFTGRAPDELVARIMSTADVGPVARPEEPAQRRVHHEQDHGVHGVRASRGRVRPAGDPGVGRRRRGVRHAQRRA